jgi:hypothetical protein
MHQPAKQAIRFLLPAFLATGVIIPGPTALAFPEFQSFVEKHSGRNVNCSLCHRNDEGPQGNGPGQLGSLTPAQMQEVNKARGAMKPGTSVDSPILSAFGNEIIRVVGMEKFAATKADPIQLATALGTTSDLDGDGIPDAEEYLDGTDPLNQYHGDPGKLLRINMQRHAGELLTALAAAIALIWGLGEILKGFQRHSDSL